MPSAAVRSHAIRPVLRRIASSVHFHTTESSVTARPEVSSASAAFPDVGTAVVTKTRSPETIGLEWARPGRGRRQRMLRAGLALQRTGGFPAATPRAPGPRNEGHSAIGAAFVCPCAERPADIQPTRRSSPIAHARRRGFVDRVVAGMVGPRRVVVPRQPRRLVPPALVDAAPACTGGSTSREVPAAGTTPPDAPAGSSSASARTTA